MTVQEAAFIVAPLLLACTWLAVVLRLFVRIRMLKSFGLDDAFIVWSTAMFSVLAAFTIAEAQATSPSATAAGEEEDVEAGLKYQVLSQVCYAVATGSLKTSIALLLLRLSSKRRFVYLLRGSIAFTVIYSIICLFLVLFQCQPVQYSWDKSIPGGTCISTPERAGIAYGYAAMTISTDWFYAILPVFMLIDIKISKHLRIYVMFVLGMGALACIATIVRMVYIVQLAHANVGFKPSPLILIWTIIELGIGTMAASMATLRPLLQYFKFTGFTESSQSESGAWPRNHSSWHEHSRVQEERARTNKMEEKSATASEEALCESEVLEGIDVHAR